jgi:hypothetical protein
LFYRCRTNNCTGNSTCSVITFGTSTRAGTYSCICLPGMIGPQCNYFASPCKYLSCQNGGTCQDITNNTVNSVNGLSYGDYRCLCPPQWTGQTCATSTNPCFTNPCSNNATCVSLTPVSFSNGNLIPGNYTCSCISGFTGSSCDLLADP